MPVRPLARDQQLENRAFVRAVRRTGNLREAARQTGVKYGTIQHRRAHHPGFALAIDAALAFAQARFAARGLSGPDGSGEALAAHRTSGGEPVIVRRNDGKLQMRRAQPGKLTKQCEQAFLAALSATANVRLSAAAAGAAEAAFYRRIRKNPGFAREFGMALETGYERLELALLESGLAESHEDDQWRRNDPPPIPPMSAGEALQLMYLHQKRVVLGEAPCAMRRKRGEGPGVVAMRLQLLDEARTLREFEAFKVAEAERRARAGEAPSPHEPPPPILPDLSQVRGWSRASRDAYYHARALFGGWRIDDMDAYIAASGQRSSLG